MKQQECNTCDHRCGCIHAARDGIATLDCIAWSTRPHPTVAEVEALVKAARDVAEKSYRWRFELHWELKDSHMQNLVEALTAFEKDSSE